MGIQVTTDQKSLYPDLVFNYQEAVPDALIANPLIATISGTIEGDKPYVRVPYIRTDPNAGYVKEGAEIPDGGGQLDEVLIATGKIATIVKQSNESAKFSTASQLIAAGVSRAIATNANSAFLNNPKATTGTEQNGPVGLLNTDGMNQITVTDPTTLVDEIANAKATIGTNGGNPTSIMVNYATESILRKLKDSEGHNLLIDPTKADALTIHGLPVIVDKAMPDNKLFVVAANEIVAAAGSVALSVSQDALFTADSLIRRATWRIGAKAIHPERLAVITLGTTASDK